MSEKENLRKLPLRKENAMLHALLAEVEKEVQHALVSDAPGEVLEALLFKVKKINRIERG